MVKGLLTPEQITDKVEFFRAEIDAGAQEMCDENEPDDLIVREYMDEIFTSLDNEFPEEETDLVRLCY